MGKLWQPGKLLLANFRVHTMWREERENTHFRLSMFAGSFMVTVSLQFDDFITCTWKETITFEKLAIFIILLHTFLFPRSRNRETRSAKAKKRKTFVFHWFWYLHSTRKFTVYIFIYVCLCKVKTQGKYQLLLLWVSRLHACWRSSGNLL